MMKFKEIFEILPKEEFMKDPMRILPLMMDFGFDARQVRMLRTVMTEDMKEVKEFLQCPNGSGYEIIENIAEYCLVSENALKDILDNIRIFLHKSIETEIINDEIYGKCRMSCDGTAFYSLDMTELIYVSDTALSFTIPDSVTEIGECAFASCSSLENVVIPDSVIEIGEYAFADCSSLENMVIPDSVIEIGEYAFAYCSSLKNVVIPDSVIEIGLGAFSCCGSILFLVNKRNEYYVSKSGALFNEDLEVLIAGYSLVSDVCVIPDSVTEIGAYAFSGCSSLKNVVIPDSVTVIGAHTFEWCRSLTEVVIPDSVTEIGKGAFFGCESLTEVVIPDSVTEIGASAFRWCVSLTEVVIPDSVTKIGKGAFAGCKSLNKPI